MIAVIQPYQFLPPSNGGHKATFEFCKSLSSLVPMVCITTFNNPVDNVPFKVIPFFEDKKSKYLSAQVAKNIIDKCKELEVDTLIITQPFMAIHLFSLSKKAGIKTIMYAHNIEFERFKSMGKLWWRGMYWLEKRAFHLSDYILCISNDDLNQFSTLFPDQKKKLINAPYIIDKTLPIPRFSKEEIRNRYNIKSSVKLLYYYGPMDYTPNREGLLLLLDEVIPKLIDQEVPFYLMLSGKGIDTVLKSKIEKYSSYVKWLGFVDDFYSHLCATDIMINPIWNGGGVKIKLMEALANNITAVAFNSGALGVDKKSVKGKLFTVKDKDTNQMVKVIKDLGEKEMTLPTPDRFFEAHDAENIIGSIIRKIG